MPRCPNPVRRPAGSQVQGAQWQMNSQQGLPNWASGLAIHLPLLASEEPLKKNIDKGFLVRASLLALDFFRLCS